VVALGLADREADGVGADLEVAEHVAQPLAGEPARPGGGPRGLGVGVQCLEQVFGGGGLGVAERGEGGADVGQQPDAVGGPGLAVLVGGQRDGGVPGPLPPLAATR
jgi:hypothetical protein